MITKYLLISFAIIISLITVNLNIIVRVDFVTLFRFGIFSIRIILSHINHYIIIIKVTQINVEEIRSLIISNFIEYWHFFYVFSWKDLMFIRKLV